MATSIFKLFGEIMVKNDKANQELDKTGKKADNLGNKFSKALGTAVKWGAGAATAVGAVGGALFKAASDTAESLDEVQKGAQKLGMSYEVFQEMSYAADRSGTSVESLSKGMKNITKDLADVAAGGEDAREAYDSLGVALENADGSMRTAEEVMLDSIKALADMEDETQRNVLASELFGGKYTELIPLLNEGSEGIDGLRQSAHDLGLVMSDEAVESGAEFGDTLADVKDGVSAVWTEISAEMLPVFKDLLTWVKDNLPEIKKIFKDAWNVMKDAVQGVWDVFNGFLDILYGLLNGEWDKIWEGLYKIVDSWVGKMAVRLGTLPGIFGFGANADKIEAEQSIEDAFEQIKEEQGFTTDEELNKYLSENEDESQKIMNNSLERLTHRLASFKSNGGASMSTEGASFGEPEMANGGSISYPGSAIVGEDGPELLSMPRGAMVTPLNNNNNAFTETNKKLDKLVELMAAYLGRPMGVYINGSALVGEIKDDMDAALGSLAVASGRGF